MYGLLNYPACRRYATSTPNGVHIKKLSAELSNPPHSAHQTEQYIKQQQHTQTPPYTNVYQHFKQPNKTPISTPIEHHFEHCYAQQPNSHKHQNNPVYQ
ncbi:hypothetical protein [Paludibacter sp. 221]|uniref:hypothetical protein n=1 Tax=Paludibacter sp. 221 TaxID=2302939 RepID=UPI0013D8378F|nr:hypothetical protein [Paludibacter sp. 221]